MWPRCILLEDTYVSAENVSLHNSIFHHVGDDTVNEWILIFDSNYVFNYRILLHIERRDQRNVDKIIKFHSITLNISILIAASYYYLNNWGEIPTKNYIGSFGCQFVAFNFYFVGCVVQSQSFFIALYRYICIVHTDLLTNIGLNGKVHLKTYIIIKLSICKNTVLQTLANIVIGVEILFALSSGLVLAIPSFPEGDSVVNYCLGRQEVYFDFDFFLSEGVSRQKSYCSIDDYIGRQLCYGFVGAILLVTSNVCEIYLLIRIVFSIKQQTNNVKFLITKSAFEERTR